MLTAATNKETIDELVSIYLADAIEAYTWEEDPL
jgi:hypothetical protein